MTAGGVERTCASRYSNRLRYPPPEARQHADAGPAKVHRSRSGRSSTAAIAMVKTIRGEMAFMLTGTKNHTIRFLRRTKMTVGRTIALVAFFLLRISIAQAQNLPPNGHLTKEDAVRAV